MLCNALNCEEPAVAKFGVTFTLEEKPIRSITVHTCVRHTAEMLAQNYEMIEETKSDENT